MTRQYKNKKLGLRLKEKPPKIRFKRKNPSLRKNEWLQINLLKTRKIESKQKESQLTRLPKKIKTSLRLSVKLQI